MKSAICALILLATTSVFTARHHVAGCGVLQRVPVTGVVCSHGPDSPGIAGCTGLLCTGLLAAPPPPPSPCLGDGHSGKRVQLFYGQQQGSPDQSSTIVSDIRTAADRVNQAYRQAGTRNVRWVCSGSESVIHIMVPDGTLAGAINALRAAGYSSQDRVYVVIETGPAQFVGWATVDGDDRPTNNANDTGPAYSIVYGANSFSLMHELGHNLGAVQLSAPHSSGAWHCYQQHDVMCFNDGGSYFQQGGKMIACDDGTSLAQEFDCGDDDYFASSPRSAYLATHWNILHSGFLEAA